LFLIKEKKQKANKSFYSSELLVVDINPRALSAFVVPKIVGAGDKAKRDIVCSQMRSIEKALEMFQMDNSV